MTTQIEVNSAHMLQVLVLDSSGNPATGKSVYCNIQRDNDNQWWNGASWVATIQDNLMSEVGSGIYEFNFTGSGVGTLSDIAFAVRYKETTLPAYQFEQLRTSYMEGDIARLFRASLGSIFDGSFADQIMNEDSGQTFDPSTDSLEAIAGKSVTGDWSASEKAQMRDALGITGTSTPASTGGVIHDIKTETDKIQTVDDNVDAIKAKTDLMGFTANNIHSHTKAKDSSLPLSSQEKVDVNAEADQALTDYDPPTRTEATSDKDEIITEVDANETKIDAIQTDVTSIKTKTDELPVDTEQELQDIDDQLDVIQERTDNLPDDPADQSLVEDAITDAVDYLDGTDDRDHTDIYNAVTAIQNNTRLKTSVPEWMQKPDTGNRAFRWSANLYDNVGNPENPDDNEILVRVLQNDGTPITGNLFKDNALTTALDNPTDTTNFPPANGWRAMEQITTGRFDNFYAVGNAETEEQLSIEFGWMEGGIGPIVFPRTSLISDVRGDIEDIQEKVDILYGKRPDDNFMGSSVKTSKDDEIDDIFTKVGAGDLTEDIPSQIDRVQDELQDNPRMTVNVAREWFVPQVQTKINVEGGISALDTTIPIHNIAGLPSSGLVKIADEYVKYSGIDGGTYELTGCTRGAYGTTPALHNDAVIVKQATVDTIRLATFDDEGNMVDADSTPVIEMFDWEHSQILAPTAMTAVAGYTGLYYYDHIKVAGDNPQSIYIRIEATVDGIDMVEDEPIVVIDKPASETDVVALAGGGTGDYACDQNGWYDEDGILHEWNDALEGPVVDAEGGEPLDDCYVTFFPVIGGDPIYSGRPTAQTLTKPGGYWLAFVDAGLYEVVFKKEGYRIDNGGRIERTVG